MSFQLPIPLRGGVEREGGREGERERRREGERERGREGERERGREGERERGQAVGSRAGGQIYCEKVQRKCIMFYCVHVLT